MISDYDPWGTQPLPTEEEVQQIQPPGLTEEEDDEPTLELVPQVISTWENDEAHPGNVANMYGIFIGVFETKSYRFSQNIGKGWYLNPDIHNEPVFLQRVLSNKQTDAALQEERGRRQKPDARVCLIILKRYASYADVPKEQRKIFAPDGAARHFVNTTAHEKKLIDMLDQEKPLKKFDFVGKLREHGFTVTANPQKGRLQITPQNAKKRTQTNPPPLPAKKRRT